MKEQLIEYNTAVLAKEKGFNLETTSYYFEDGELKENSLTGTNGYYGDEYEVELEEFYENWNNNWLTTKNGDRCFGCQNNPKYLNTYSAPSQGILQKWLREVHNLHIDIRTNYVTKGKYFYSVMQNKKPYHTKIADNEYYDTYEEVLEQALFNCLHLVN